MANLTLCIDVLRFSEVAMVGFNKVKLRNMERTLLLSLAIAFISSLCFAQEASAASIISNSTASVQAKIKTFIGQVDVVSDWNAEIKPKIVVRDDKGMRTTFIVPADIAIIGKDGDLTTLGWTKDNKVAIEYIESQAGIKTAQSIKVLTD